MHVQPYLFFDGRCEEAIEFYKRTLGAEVGMMMRFKDSPDPQTAANSTPGTENKVMHARLRIGDTMVMASDGRALGKPAFQGFALSLTVPDAAGAERMFAALGEGGQVQMPLTKTFFAPLFGMVADRFGVSWMVIVEHADAQAPGASAEFTIARTFDAPRAKVFAAWTEEKHLAQWWGPKGMKTRVIKLDAKPGGQFHYCMQASTGAQMWGRFIYREVAAPERLVYISSFADEQGNVTRAPFSGNFPREILNTVTFAESGGKTTVTLRGAPVDATAEERASFEGMFASMTQGFGATFDQLDAYLAKG